MSIQYTVSKIESAGGAQFRGCVIRSARSSITRPARKSAAWSTMAAAACVLSALLAAPCARARPATQAQTAAADQPSADSGEEGVGSSGQAVNLSPPPATSALRYDSEYPVIGYSGTPMRNPVARLQQRLESGTAKLEFKAPRGYLDSLLKNLGIDPSSQTLVYSKSSLQVDYISSATPRAIYFNDNIYVAYLPNSPMIEIVTMDDTMGPVFYSIPNRTAGAARVDREVLRCLACHDKFSLAGGGVPLFLIDSTFVDVNGVLLGSDSSSATTDQTPLSQRWAGWYVTGHSEQDHLGNIMVHNKSELAAAERKPRNDLDNLDRLFDTRPYLRDTSDIVALLILEHQTTVHNQITRINFKARTLVARAQAADGSGNGSWDELPQRVRKEVQRLTEPIVRAMLFVNAAPITGKISGTSGFDRWFQAQGPRDAQGHSLRELDLTKRLFKYPLSYLVYSEAFDALPDYAKSYIYHRFAQVLSGQDQSPQFAHLSAADRKAISGILLATKPEYAKVAATMQTSVAMR